MPTLLRRDALFFAALAASALHLVPCSVHAQSAYTMTVLAKPSGATAFAPTSLANDDTVRGGMTYWAGFGVDATFACVIFCPAYLPREVVWANTTGATAAASVGLRGFYPTMANDKGTQVGQYTTEKKVAPTYSGTHVRLPGAAPSLIPPLPGVREFFARDINNNDVIVGNDILSYVPMVSRQGVTIPLPLGSYTQGRTSRVNNAGLIVGTVTDAVGRGTPFTRLAVWAGDQLVTVGGPETIDRHPVALNNAGQVLLADLMSFANFSGHGNVWLNGVVTPVNDPKGRSVEPAAMNDSGTVVGCTRVLTVSGTQPPTDFEPFIWRNGLMQDLTAELATKGVKLPADTRFGCPRAINNRGSMLIYHYKVGAPDKVTWVRLNARP